MIPTLFPFQPDHIIKQIYHNNKQYFYTKILFVYIYLTTIINSVYRETY